MKRAWCSRNCCLEMLMEHIFSIIKQLSHSLFFCRWNYSIGFSIFFLLFWCINWKRNPKVRDNFWIILTPFAFVSEKLLSPSFKSKAPLWKLRKPYQRLGLSPFICPRELLFDLTVFLLLFFLLRKWHLMNVKFYSKKRKKERSRQEKWVERAWSSRK